MATIDFYVYSLHSFISLQNLPRDALPDGSPVREKLANFKRPKKFKTSENDFSHGSFFLRIGGISKLEILYPIHIWNFHIGNISHAKLHLRSGAPYCICSVLELSFPKVEFKSHEIISK